MLCIHKLSYIYYCVSNFCLELEGKDSAESTIFVLFGEVVEQLTQVKPGDLIYDFENVSIK